MARVYATTSDLASATDDQLQRASLAVDRALIGAIYDTDTEGMPTGEAVTAALRDATVAQAWAIAAAETARQPLKSASIGKASYTYADRTPGGLTLPAGGGLCPDAATILQLAGLVPAGVITYG